LVEKKKEDKRRSSTHAKNFRMQLGGRKLIVETGKNTPSRPAGPACTLRRHGGAYLRDNRENRPRRGGFSALSVEFEEKLYAVGKIPAA
jgi:polyribonucleotide nucleotidyltransferase